MEPDADPAADELIRRFQRERAELLAYALALTGGAEAADDVFQEVAVVVLRRRADFRADGDFSAWCRGIARNVAKEMRRRDQRRWPLDDARLAGLIDQAFDEQPAADTAADQREKLRACLGRLRPDHARLLDLRYVQGLPLAAIAQRLERRAVAVRVALTRLRQALRACVERQARGDAR